MASRNLLFRVPRSRFSRRGISFPTPRFVRRSSRQPGAQRLASETWDEDVRMPKSLAGLSKSR